MPYYIQNYVLAIFVKAQLTLYCVEFPAHLRRIVDHAEENAERRSSLWRKR